MRFIILAFTVFLLYNILKNVLRQGPAGRSLPGIISGRRCDSMSDNNSNSRNTKYFDPLKNTDNMVREVIKTVYEALEEKGYNPVSQIIGYIMSGDPTYITSHKNARYLITRVERDELLEEILESYIDANFK